MRINRPWNADETPFGAEMRDADGNTMLCRQLSAYAEVDTPHGIIGAPEGAYLVEGPDGTEVLGPDDYAERFAVDEMAEAEAEEKEAEKEPDPYEHLSDDEIQEAADALGWESEVPHSREELIEFINGKNEN